MIKFMAFIARKPGLSRQAFIDYYETRHAPLVVQVGLRMAVYKRNYATDKVYGPNSATTTPFDFDAITEICFDTKADYAAFKAVLADPVVHKQIDEDEKNFIDQSKTWMHAVDERS